MLTIAKEQIDTLDLQMREDYIKRTLRNLAELFPDDPAVKDERATRDLVDDAIRAAADYGITHEREVTLFVFLVQDLGREFEKLPQYPWIQAILLDPELEEQEKMDVIYTRLEFGSSKT